MNLNLVVFAFKDIGQTCPLYFYAYYKFITRILYYICQSYFICPPLVGLFIFLAIGQNVLLDKFSQSTALKDRGIETINLRSKSRKMRSRTL